MAKEKKIKPSKFNAFFAEFEKVVFNPNVEKDDEGNEIESPNHNAIIFTDLELVDETNSRLPVEKQITKRTFENWKSALLSGSLEDEIEFRFFRVYQKALRMSKEKLFNSLVMDRNGWQRFAWIMERKFNDQWGQKKPDEDDAPAELPAIKIVKNYDQKKLKKN